MPPCVLSFRLLTRHLYVVLPRCFQLCTLKYDCLPSLPYPMLPLFLCLSEWLCHHHPASHQSQTPRAIVDSVPHPSFSVSPQAVPTASEIPSRVLVLSLCIRTTLVRPSPAPWPVSTSFPPGLSASHFATRPPSCPVPLPKHAKAQMKQSPSRVCDLKTPCPKFLSKLLSAVLPLHSTLRQF